MVGSPRRIYGFGAALVLLGVGALLLTLITVVRSTSVGVPAAHELAMACQRVLPAGLTVGSVAVLALAAIAAVAVSRGVSSALRQLLAHRGFLAALDITDRRSIGGTEISVVAGRNPQAFCAGHLRPAIYLSERALGLSDEELAAVVAHEAHHQRRRDPLRLLVARVLTSALFFVPVLRQVGKRYEAIAELRADDAAAVEPEGRRALASALLAFESAGPAVVGIAPERVDHLLGGRPRWELPLSLLLGSLVAIGGLAAMAVVTSQAMAGAAISPSMLLAQGCMILMAVAPLLLLATGLPWARRTLAQRPRG